jgi:hypothetical protein
LKKLALAAVAVSALTGCGTPADPNITQDGQETTTRKAKTKVLHTVVYTVEGSTRKGSITTALRAARSRTTAPSSLGARPSRPTTVRRST